MTRCRPTWRLLLAAVAVTVLVALSCPTRALAADSEPTLAEAQCAIVTDGVGNVLYSKNAYTEMPMASITKIMTAMVALDSGIPMDTVVNLQDVDLGANSQTAGYKGGETATFGELMTVMLVYSANDAAEEIALEVAGSEEAFVQLMNEKAEELGMTHTHFANPHGLEADNHYSCVADLAVMGRYALTNYSFIASTVKKRSVTVTIGGVSETFASTDELMDSYQGLLGIKTGSVSSGTTFLGASERDGVRLYTAVLGCSTTEGRFADTASLMDWAYQTYDSYQLTHSGWIVRYANYAYHFGLRCLVSSSTDTYGSIWPDGGTTSYSKVMTKPSIMVVPDEPYGAELWTQDGRVVAAASYVTRGVVRQIPSFGLFNSLLFVDQSTLGAAS